MTANELAEIADGLSCEIPIREWIDNEPKNVMNDIATMLRKQQAEIEKLGSELDRIVELYTDKAIENEALHKKIIDLSFDLEYAKRTDEFVNWSEK